MVAMKAPFPYFGGKSSVAGVVWDALGDCAHYLEPFFGSGAVLLARPSWHRSKVETVCDANGHLANVWRAIQRDPDEVARWCDWPVNHADLIARKKYLHRVADGLLEWLCNDDDYCETKAAGYWVWCACCGIGTWWDGPNQRPHISHAGCGVHSPERTERPMSLTRSPGAPYCDGVYSCLRGLSVRLRRVRVVCGDWSRICGGDWQDNPGVCGIFFDPPYGDEKRDPGCYETDSMAVAGDVREWCVRRGNRKSHRIVLAGYYEEHESLLSCGWTVHRWKAQGGYGNASGLKNDNARREALFMSPHCLREEMLFDVQDETSLSND